MPKKIMIVDDSKSVRAVIGMTLKMGGYSTVLADDGVEALKALDNNNEEPVDLIITDINMPNMDGVTFIKELKKRPDLSSIPICVLTTESEQGKFNEEIGSFNDAWITKPVQPAHILNVVGDLLGD